MNQAILIFVKNLNYGKVKTRLAATIGNDQAMTVYQHLLQHTRTITELLPVTKIVCYAEFVEQDDSWNNNIYRKQLQQGEDLGARMQHAFETAFDDENSQVAIIGSDCLQITASHIMEAFTGLNKHDIVIGPATDGGYYLLAMKQMHRSLFKNISWSSKEVFRQTLAICNLQQLSVYLLPELTDIDTENDLGNLNEQLSIKKLT
jgi:uncharacterized protein